MKNVRQKRKSNLRGFVLEEETVLEQTSYADIATVISDCLRRACKDGIAWTNNENYFDKELNHG